MLAASDQIYTCRWKTQAKMGLDSFLDRERSPPRALAVINRTSPDPAQRMLERLFERQSIEIEELNDEQLGVAEESNTVVLTDGEDILAQSPLQDLMETVLLVNSDIYVTGARELDESDLPDVLTGLNDVPFRMRSYPESNSEKLLLIAISRMIEQRAWEHDGGTLRSSFQQLSRIRDEKGTFSVYQALADSGVDVHVYGVPNWTPTKELAVTMHGGDDADFRDSWFVLFRTPEGTVQDAGLLTIESEPGVWDGFWTYDQDRIQRINRYIEREL